MPFSNPERKQEHNYLVNLNMMWFIDCTFLIFIFLSFRIERLWRDVWNAVSSIYYDLLHSLEEDDLLDPANCTHLFCAQYVFLPRIQEDLDTFSDGWNNHAIRTEGNFSPNQLWVIGEIQSPVSPPDNVEVKKKSFFVVLYFIKHCGLQV